MQPQLMTAQRRVPYDPLESFSKTAAGALNRKNEQDEDLDGLTDKIHVHRGVGMDSTSIEDSRSNNFDDLADDKYGGIDSGNIQFLMGSNADEDAMGVTSDDMLGSSLAELAEYSSASNPADLKLSSNASHGAGGDASGLKTLLKHENEALFAEKPHSSPASSHGDSSFDDDSEERVEAPAHGHKHDSSSAKSDSPANAEVAERHAAKPTTPAHTSEGSSPSKKSSGHGKSTSDASSANAGSDAHEKSTALDSSKSSSSSGQKSSRSESRQDDDDDNDDDADLPHVAVGSHKKPAVAATRRSKGRHLMHVGLPNVAAGSQSHAGSLLSSRPRERRPSTVGPHGLDL